MPSQLPNAYTRRDFDSAASNPQFANLSNLSVNTRLLCSAHVKEGCWWWHAEDETTAMVTELRYIV